MEGQGNIWKSAFLTLFIFVLLGAVGVFAYLLGAKKLSLPGKAVTPTPTTLPQLSPSPVLSPTQDETDLIKAAIYTLTGLDEVKAEVIIDQNTGIHAKGGIREYGAVGGAYWIAAKSDGEWIGVYAGQTHPTCNEIASYDFPTDMVPECLDSSGKVVIR
ncbi:hypothetical protein KAT60_01190 [Candidatus Woesebacteria bacterium]|nr:hypothetical protein [Candidatus Woesebacteria bacterium]